MESLALHWLWIVKSCHEMFRPKIGILHLHFGLRCILSYFMLSMHHFRYTFTTILRHFQTIVYVSHDAFRLSVYFALWLSKNGFIFQIRSIIQQPKVNLELDQWPCERQKCGKKFRGSYWFSIPNWVESYVGTWLIEVVLKVFLIRFCKT